MAEHALAIVIDGRRRADADGGPIQHIRQLVVTGLLEPLLVHRTLLERRTPVAVADALPLLDGRMSRNLMVLLLLIVLIVVRMRFHSRIHHRLLHGQ